MWPVICATLSSRNPSLRILLRSSSRASSVDSAPQATGILFRGLLPAILFSFFLKKKETLVLSQIYRSSLCPLSNSKMLIFAGPPPLVRALHYNTTGSHKFRSFLNSGDYTCRESDVFASGRQLVHDACLVFSQNK